MFRLSTVTRGKCKCEEPCTLFVQLLDPYDGMVIHTLCQKNARRLAANLGAHARGHHEVDLKLWTWSVIQERELKRMLSNGLTRKQIAVHMNRSYKAIKNKVQEMRKKGQME
jgi:hypothetical protein